jgi:hypothetical protein
VREPASSCRIDAGALDLSYRYQAKQKPECCSAAVGASPLLLFDLPARPPNLP